MPRGSARRRRKRRWSAATSCARTPGSTSRSSRRSSSRSRTRARRRSRPASHSRMRASASRTRTCARRPSGTILTRLVERGQVISSPTRDVGGGTVILTMADLTRVRARVRVDETDIGKLAAGVPARIQVTAFPGREFTGAVEKIEPQAVVDQNVTMFAVLINVGERGGAPEARHERGCGLRRRRARRGADAARDGAARGARHRHDSARSSASMPDKLRTEVGAPAGGAGARRARGRRRARRGARARPRAVGRRGEGWDEQPTPVETGITDLDRVEITGGLARGRTGAAAADGEPGRDPAADPGRREPPRRHPGTHAEARERRAHSRPRPPGSADAVLGDGPPRARLDARQRCSAPRSRCSA